MCACLCCVLERTIFIYLSAISVHQHPWEPAQNKALLTLFTHTTSVALFLQHNLTTSIRLSHSVCLDYHWLFPLFFLSWLLFTNNSSRVFLLLCLLLLLLVAKKKHYSTHRNYSIFNPLYRSLEALFPIISWYCFASFYPLFSLPFWYLISFFCFDWILMENWEYLFWMSLPVCYDQCSLEGFLFPFWKCHFHCSAATESKWFLFSMCVEIQSVRNLHHSNTS